MKSSIVCPCCSENMLRHINGPKEYWFCCNCRQEMPNLNEVKKHNFYLKAERLNLSIGLEFKQKMILA